MYRSDQARGSATAVLLLAAAAFVLRWHVASAAGLSRDEALVANIIERPWAELVPTLRHDGNFPLFYALLKLWRAALGPSEAALELLPVLLGALLVPLAALFARKAFGSSAAVLAAALLTALSTPLVYYSSLLRIYSLLMLLGLASTLAFLLLHTGRAT